MHDVYVKSKVCTRCRVVFLVTPATLEYHTRCDVNPYFVKTYQRDYRLKHRVR